ncbi:hypothetical protein PVAP13_8KG256401 [Panicum virgatum]|uniref:Uncharacterized protein n=1 Tax=Panicum virgatum TaxID=38727 RepID=A0A8T0PJG9_PANVG|nr:hypothetical protein PVAP13_8KG256401 [Panicum virgatum]
MLTSTPRRLTSAQLAGPGRAEAGPARWSAQRVGAGRSAARRVPAAYRAAEQSSGAEEGATEGGAAQEAAASTGGREGGGSEATARRGDVSEAMARRGGDGAARIRPESTARGRVGGGVGARRGRCATDLVGDMEGPTRRGRAGCSAEGPARERTAAAAVMDVNVRERKKGGWKQPSPGSPLYATQFSTGPWLRSVLNWR